MKFALNKKAVIKAALFTLCLTLLISLFFLSKHFLPGAICYSVSSSATAAGHTSPAKSEQLCESLSEINGDGPFIIRMNDDGIYVLSDSKPVYRINAVVSEFTDGDIEQMKKGLLIRSRAELFEIVSFMES